MLVLPFEITNSTVRTVKSGKLKISMSVEGKAEGNETIVLGYKDVLFMLEILRGIHSSMSKMLRTELDENDEESLRSRSLIPRFKILQSIGEIEMASGRMDIQMSLDVKKEGGEMIPLGDGMVCVLDVFKDLMEQFENLAVGGYRRLSQSR